MRRNKGQHMHSPGSAGGRAGEVQFLVLATRDQEVTAAGLEDGPVGDWLVAAVGGAKTWAPWGGAAPRATSWLVTPNFGTIFLFLSSDFLSLLG